MWFSNAITSALSIARGTFCSQRIQGCQDKVTAQHQILAMSYLCPTLAAPGLAMATGWVLNPLAGLNLLLCSLLAHACTWCFSPTICVNHPSYFHFCDCDKIVFQNAIQKSKTYSSRLQSITVGKSRQKHKVANHITSRVKSREKWMNACMLIGDQSSLSTLTQSRTQT